MKISYTMYPNIGDFLGYLEKHPFFILYRCSPFLGNFWENWATFYSTVWVTLITIHLQILDKLDSYQKSRSCLDDVLGIRTQGRRIEDVDESAVNPYGIFY